MSIPAINIFLLILFAVLTSQQSIELDAFCQSNLEYSDFYASNQTFQIPLALLFFGFNLTYSSQSASGNTSTSIISLNTPVNTTNITFQTIVGSDTYFEGNTKSSFCVLEYQASANIYNVYLTTTQGRDQSPIWGDAVYSFPISGSGIVSCLEIVALNNPSDPQCLISCFGSGAGSVGETQNIFATINSTGLQNFYNFSNWEPTWKTITGQQIVPYTFNPNILVLTVISPNSNIIPAYQNQPVNNFMDYYQFVLSNQTMEYVFQANQLVLSSPGPLIIYDSAQSLQRVYLLTSGYVYQMNFINSQGVSYFYVFPLYFIGYKIAVFQTDVLTTIAIASYVNIQVLKLNYQLTQLEGGAEIYQSIYQLETAGELFMNQFYITISRFDNIFVFDRLKFQQYYGETIIVVENPMQGSHYNLILTPYNSGFLMGQTQFSIFYFQAPILVINNFMASDVITVNATSTAIASNSVEVAMCNFFLNITYVDFNTLGSNTYMTNLSVPASQIINKGGQYVQQINPIPQIYLGANLSYSINLPNTNQYLKPSVELSIPTVVPTIFPNNVNFNPGLVFTWNQNDLVYYTILVNNATNKVYVFACSQIQILTSQAQIYCQLNQTLQVSGSVGTIEMSSVNSNIQGTEYNTILYTISCTVNIGTTQAFNDLIYICFLDGSTICSPQILQFSSNVTDIAILGPFVLVATPFIQTISIFEVNSQQQISAVTNIDSSTVESWPLQNGIADWTPAYFHYSTVFPNILIIGCNTSLITIGFELTYVKTIFFNQLPVQSVQFSTQWQRAVAVYGYNAILAENLIQNNNSTPYTNITVYTLAIPNTLTYVRTLSTYGYTISFPIIWGSSVQSNLFFIVAQNGSNYYILNYKISNSLVSSLYYIFPLPSGFIPFNLAVTGGTINYVILSGNNNNQTISYMVPESPAIISSTSIDSSAPFYSTALNFSISAASVGQIGMTYVGVNTQIELSTSNSYFQQTYDFLGKAGTKFTLDPSQWLYGSFLGFSLGASSYPDVQFSIQNRIFQSNASLQSTNTSPDLSSLDYIKISNTQTGLVTLFSNGTFVIYPDVNNLNYQNSYFPQTPAGVVCPYLTSQITNSTLYGLYILCYNSNPNVISYFLIYYSFTLPALTYQVSNIQIQLPQIQFMNYVQVISVSQLIFSLSRRFTSGPTQGNVVLFTLNFTAATASATTYYNSSGSQSNCSLPSTLNPSYFQYTTTTPISGLSLLTILDSYGQHLTFVTLQNQISSLPCSNSTSFNLQNTIYQLGIYMEEDTSFTGLWVLDSQIVNNTNLNIIVLVQVYLAPLIQLSITLQFPTPNVIQYNFIKCSAIYNRYGFTDLLPQLLYISNNIFGFLNYNQSNFQTYLTVYELQNANATIFTIPSTLTPTPISAGLLIDQPSSLFNMGIQSYSYSNFIIFPSPSGSNNPLIAIWNYSSSNLLLFNYTSDYVITILNDTDQNASVIIYPISDYSNIPAISIGFQFKESDLKLWWFWLIIVLIILLVIGSIGLVIYQIKQSKSLRVSQFVDIDDEDDRDFEGKYPNQDDEDYLKVLKNQD